MLRSDYLSNLNEKQQEAVLQLDGPLLIVAGAGSGKTKVYFEKISMFDALNLAKEVFKVFSSLSLISSTLLKSKTVSMLYEKVDAKNLSINIVDVSGLLTVIIKKHISILDAIM